MSSSVGQYGWKDIFWGSMIGREYVFDLFVLSSFIVSIYQPHFYHSISHGCREFFGVSKSKHPHEVGYEEYFSNAACLTIYLFFITSGLPIVLTLFSLGKDMFKYVLIAVAGFLITFNLISKRGSWGISDLVDVLLLFSLLWARYAIASVSAKVTGKVHGHEKQHHHHDEDDESIIKPLANVLFLFTYVCFLVWSKSELLKLPQVILTS